LGHLSVGSGELSVDDKGFARASLRLDSGKGEGPAEQSTPPLDTPQRLLSLSITPDRDRFLSEDHLVVLSAAVFQEYVVLDFAEAESVWKDAGETVSRADRPWCKKLVDQIKSDRTRLAQAQDRPASFEGRVLKASRISATAAGRQLAGEAVAFVAHQLGDFGGLRSASCWGVCKLRRIYQICGGDIGAIWTTMQEEGVDAFYGNSRLSPFLSFIFPFVRQNIVLFVPASPSIARTSDTTSVYLINSPLARKLRRAGLQAVARLISDPPPDVDDLDTPNGIYPVLHLLHIVPGDGYRRRDTSLQASAARGSPSWPFGTGLLEAPVERPLFQTAWSESDFVADGTVDSCTWLAGEEERDPATNRTASSASLVLARARAALEAHGQARQMAWGFGDEEEEEGEDDEDKDEEDGGLDKLTEEEESRRLAELQQMSALYQDTCRRDHRAVLARVEALVQRHFPGINTSDIASLPLTPSAARSVANFLEDDDVVWETFENSSYVLNNPHLVQTCKLHNQPLLPTYVRQFARAIGIPIFTYLLRACGSLNVRLISHASIVPVVLHTKQALNDASFPILLTAVYLTSRDPPIWTTSSAPSFATAEALLDASDAPQKIAWHGKTYFQRKRVWQGLRSVARVFSLAQLPDVAPLGRGVVGLDFPQPSEQLLYKVLQPLRNIPAIQRTTTPVSTLEKWIFKLGGHLQSSADEGNICGRNDLSSEAAQIRFRRLTKCWSLLEEVVLATVGESRFAEFFGAAVDWERTTELGYILSCN
ncbi:hypothetical protein RTBOTA2_006735, partial [Rhodotorula toruloides]